MPGWAERGSVGASAWGRTGRPCCLGTAAPVAAGSDPGHETAPAGGVAGAVARSDSGGDEPDQQGRGLQGPAGKVAIPPAENLKPRFSKLFSVGCYVRIEHAQ
jgi:hypothetical protein